MKSFLSKKGYNKVTFFFALRAPKKGTIKSFLSKRGYNTVKMFFALRAQRKGTSQKIVFVLRAQKKVQ